MWNINQSQILTDFHLNNNNKNFKQLVDKMKFFNNYYLTGFTVNFVKILFKMFFFDQFIRSKLIQRFITAWFILVLLGVLLTPFFFMHVEDAGKIVVLIHTLVYVVKIVAHMVTLVEVFSFCDVGKKMEDKMLEIDEDIGLKLYQKMRSLHTLNTDVYCKAFLLIAFICVNYVIVIATNVYHELGNLNRFQWLSLCSAIACEVRMVQVIVDLSKIRIRMKYFHEAILNLSKIRRPLAFSKKSQFYLKLKMEKVLALKIIYDKIFGVCEDVNNCYGSSLLVIVGVVFVDITCNCYQIFLSIEIGEIQFVGIVYSFSIILQMVVIVWILCWHSQQCSAMVGAWLPNTPQNICGFFFSQRLLEVPLWSWKVQTTIKNIVLYSVSSPCKSFINPYI